MSAGSHGQRLARLKLSGDSLNRIEKLLFSKRSPLRRALIDETSREERLRLLPKIFRAARDAGVLTSDNAKVAERLIAGKRKSDPGSIVGIDELHRDLLRQPEPLERVMLGPEQIALLAARAGMAVILESCFDQTTTAQYAVQRFDMLLAALAGMFDILAEKPFAAHLPVIGVAVQLIDRRRQKRLYGFVDSLGELRTHLVGNQHRKDKEAKSKRILADGREGSRSAPNPSGSARSGKPALSGVFGNGNDLGSLFADLSTSRQIVGHIYRHFSNALNMLWVQLSASAAFAVSYINAGRELTETRAKPHEFVEYYLVSALISPVKNIFERFSEAYTSAVDHLGWGFYHFLPLDIIAYWILIGFFTTCSLFITTWYFLSNTFVNRIDSLAKRLSNEISNLIDVEMGVDSEEDLQQDKKDKELANFINNSKYVVEAANAPNLNFYSIFFLAPLVIIGPFIVLFLVTEIIFSYGWAIISSISKITIGSLRPFQSKYNSRLDFVKRIYENNDSIDVGNYRTFTTRKIRKVFSGVVIALSIVLPVLVSPAVHALTKDLVPEKKTSTHATQSDAITLALDECPPSQIYLPLKQNMYLRVSDQPGAGPARLALRPQDIPAQMAVLPEGQPLVIGDTSSTEDWGLAKRGSGIAVKPVETATELRLAPADAGEGGELVLEPAYINVKLCVREGVELPPELAALATEGAN